MSDTNKIQVHVDGGSRDNPGPAALGVVFAKPLEKQYSKYLGKATNNEAEYQSVIFALEKLKSLIGKEKAKDTEVEIFMDSQLAVKQLSHEYKIESEKIIPLFVRVHNLRMDYKKVTFRHVKRENNKEADKLVNAELDKQSPNDSLFNL